MSHALREKQIHNILWKEFAFKAKASSYTFILFAIMMFYYYFQLEEYKDLIKTVSILIIVCNIARLFLLKKISLSTMTSSSQKAALRITTWLNTLGWSIIFTTGSYALSSTSFHLAILVTMVSGFVAASMITLSYDKAVFYPFQYLLLGPLAINAFYQWFTGVNPHAINFVFCCVMFIFYQSKQMKVYYSQIIERINYQLDLEKSLNEVKAAQTALVDQTASLLHAAKITGLGEMAGGLSHEVNNSLQVILGTTQQIQRELVREEITLPILERKFEQNELAIMKIKTVIEGLRQFSQEMDVSEKSEVSLKEIFDKTFVYTQELLKAHEINFMTDEIPDLKIQCHPFQIIQVLFNLIKNADDAIRRASSEKWIRITFEETKNFIFILVSNSGEKIHPEHQAKLFQPFFSTKDVNLGTGLSLSISRGIALDHKGDLFYRPLEEHTTFVLKLPKSE